MATADRWYFAYGSNLSRERMIQRTGPIVAERLAKLDGFRLAFNVTDIAGTERYANIVPSPGGVVWGAAYWCSCAAIAELDKYEEIAIGCYMRQWIDVEAVDGRPLHAEVYIGGKQFIVSDGRPPSDWYWRIVLSGAREHQLPEAYIRGIELLATKS